MAIVDRKRLALADAVLEEGSFSFLKEGKEDWQKFLETTSAIN